MELVPLEGDYLPMAQRVEEWPGEMTQAQAWRGLREAGLLRPQVERPGEWKVWGGVQW